MSEAKDVARFESKVDRSGGPDACHLFNGYCHHGYGRAWIGNRKQWAHRAAWILAHGEIPTGAEVAHTCDVRNCVNPAHLWLATHAENMSDMFTKQRHKHGENASKLTAAQALAIREERRLGTPIAEVATRFGVSLAQVSRIANGTRWAHLATPTAPSPPPGPCSPAGTTTLSALPEKRSA